MEINFIIQIFVLIFSVIIHEIAHGYAALALGDVTAKYQGRLTMNPIRHIDLFGSIILPVLLFITKAPFMLAWAKPVPFNPYNLKNQRWGELLIAIAGPASNIALAFLLGLILKIAPFFNLAEGFYAVITYAIIINIVLAVFNLMPIPPLDGSKVLFGLWPSLASKYRAALESYGMFLIIPFIIFLWPLLTPALIFLIKLISLS